jgi:hypothetical protein
MKTRRPAFGDEARQEPPRSSGWAIDTQTLRRKIDLAHEHEWRHDVADQFDQIDKAARDLRDRMIRVELKVEDKAGDTDIQNLQGQINLLKQDMIATKRIVWVVLIGCIAIETLSKVVK